MEGGESGENCGHGRARGDRTPRVARKVQSVLIDNIARRQFRENPATENKIHLCWDRERRLNYVSTAEPLYFLKLAKCFVLRVPDAQSGPDMTCKMFCV